MKQLIQELKLFSVDSNQFEPRHDAMMIKNIIDEPTFHNSGRITLPIMDTTTFYELKRVNYVFLNADNTFHLLLDDKVLINTSQFGFVNRYQQLTIAVQSLSVEVNIDFTFGTVRLGDESDALSTSYGCMTRWDKVLKNIIYQPSEYEATIEDQSVLPGYEVDRLIAEPDGQYLILSPDLDSPVQIPRVSSIQISM